MSLVLQIAHFGWLTRPRLKRSCRTAMKNRLYTGILVYLTGLRATRGKADKRGHSARMEGFSTYAPVGTAAGPEMEVWHRKA